MVVVWRNNILFVKKEYNTSQLSFKVSSAALITVEEVTDQQIREGKRVADIDCSVTKPSNEE